ncbi:MAG: hypothetical protein DI535_20170 [Citrobacter freundii]|nr:MAG: hypothetical protein DI535_20170 [Citrobacter freundii]
MYKEGIQISVQFELFADGSGLINAEITDDREFPGAGLHFSQLDQTGGKFKIDKLRRQFIAIDHKRLTSPEFLLAQKPDGEAASL